MTVHIEKKICYVVTQDNSVVVYKEYDINHAAFIASRWMLNNKYYDAKYGLQISMDRYLKIHTRLVSFIMSGDSNERD